MARLERENLVEGRYEQVLVGEKAATERRYRLTARGRTQWTHAHEFYAEVSRAPGRLRWSDA
jgi:hypothetical protein